MLLSFQMLPEQPAAELLDAVALADGLGYYACYSADEIYHKDAWLLFAAAAAAHGADQARALRGADLHAGADLRRSARRHARRAQRRARGGRVRDRQHRDARAVRRRVARNASDRPPARGAPGHAHRPRRGRDRLRGRLLQLHGRDDGGASRAGAPAAEDRRDGGPQVDGAGRRDRRRPAHGLRVLTRGAGLRGRALSGSAPSAPAGARRASISATPCSARSHRTARWRVARGESSPRSTSRRCRRRCSSDTGSSRSRSRRSPRPSPRATFNARSRPLRRRSPTGSWWPGRPRTGCGG